MAGLAPVVLPGVARAYDKSVVIPLQTPHNRPWCVVAINDSPPRPFLFSIGTAENLLGRRLAADLRIKRGLAATSRLPVGPDPGERYFLRRLTVSGAVTQSQVYAHGADALEGAHLDGVVSADLYAGTSVVIDLDAGRLRLGDISQFDVSGQETLRTQAPPARRASPLQEQFTTYGGPVAFLDVLNPHYDPRPLVVAEIDGHQVRLLLDTGYPGSVLLFPQFVQDEGLLDAYPRGQRLFTSTYDRRFSARHVRARELRIGSTVLADPVVALALPQALRPGPLRIDGVIGAEVLRRLVVTFDPQFGRIWLRRNDLAGQPFAYNRAGASLRSEDEHIVVDAVTPGSPAFRAGVDPGDRIVGWSGDGGLDALSCALQGPPGEAVELIVARGDRRAPVKLVLAELI